MAKKRGKFRTQKNGRERGLPGDPQDAFQNTMPIVHAQIHKGKREMRDREDRKRKSNRWED